MVHKLIQNALNQQLLAKSSLDSRVAKISKIQPLSFDELSARQRRAPEQERAWCWGDLGCNNGRPLRPSRLKGTSPSSLLVERVLVGERLPSPGQTHRGAGSPELGS